MIIVRQPADMTPPKEGTTVRLSAPPEQLHVFDAETGRRIDGTTR
jgi:hypothetical protein